MINGRTIAMAVCGLMMTAAPNLSHAQDKTKEAKVKCQIDECGGNGCNAKQVEVTEKECKEKKGKVVPEKKADDKAKPAAPAKP
jgi:hypothetical protein